MNFHRFLKSASCLPKNINYPFMVMVDISHRFLVGGVCLVLLYINDVCEFIVIVKLITVS